jgi:hypothetical protein
MTNVQPLPAELFDDETSVGAPADSDERTGSFFGALATLLHETVAKFETTVGQVTDLTIKGPGRSDRELVVALQDFDRLQQEFAALAYLLAKVGAAPEAIATGTLQAGLDAIADVSIAQLKMRLVEHMAANSAPPDESTDPEEMVF